jgi:hypothetical protein
MFINYGLFKVKSYFQFQLHWKKSFQNSDLLFMLSIDSALTLFFKYSYS